MILILASAVSFIVCVEMSNVEYRMCGCLQSEGTCFLTICKIREIPKKCHKMCVFSNIWVLLLKFGAQSHESSWNNKIIQIRKVYTKLITYLSMALGSLM